MPPSKAGPGTGAASPDRRALRRLADQARAWRDDVVTATLFLTRLPVPGPTPLAEGSNARSMRAYPLVGAAIGLLGAALFALALWLGLPPEVAALTVLAGQILATGGLHEDGLADLADGLGGGRDRDAKLAIMRDSRLGSYGGLALILSVLFRAGALAALNDPVAATAALAAAGATSRAAMPVLMTSLPSARADGVAAGHGPVAGRVAVTAVVLAITLSLVLLGLGRGLAALGIGLGAGMLLALVVRRQLGGYTGDALGALQQIVEVAMLLTLATRS